MVGEWGHWSACSVRRQMYTCTFPPMIRSKIRLNPFPHNDTLTCLGKTPFQNIVGKGENLLFLHCFLLYQRQKLSFMLHLFCRLQMLSIWTRSNICRLGMGYELRLDNVKEYDYIFVHE